jgi:hypothetical protein
VAGRIDTQTMGAVSTTQIAQPYRGTRPPAALARSLLTASGWTGGVVVEDLDPWLPSLGTTTGGNAPPPPRRKPTRKVTPTRTSTAATKGLRDGGNPSGAGVGRLSEVGGPPKLAMSSAS